MDDLILFTQLNDFIFCPVSIYFHNFYSNTAEELYKDTPQIQGTAAHDSIDNKRYSTRKEVLQGIEVFSEKYGLVGKIDVFDVKTGVLTERKRKIKQIFEGYIFQLYAQCFAMREMGYSVKKLRLYSISDNKSYDILLPEEDHETLDNFENTVKRMRSFSIEDFCQDNALKCKNCIYEPACDRGLV